MSTVFLTSLDPANISTAILNTNLGLTGSNLYNWLTGVSGNGTSLSILVNASGALLNQPQINLAGGTGLVVNNIYYDNFSSNRVLNFSGNLIDSAYINLRLNTLSQVTIGFPASYRLGQSGSITGLTFIPGNQEISWVYSNSKWWMADTVGLSNNFSAARSPLITDDFTAGYSVGSHWINTGTQLIYQCTSANSGAAQWFNFISTGMTGGFGGVSAATLAITSGILATGTTALSGNLNQMVISIQTTGSWGPVLANVSTPFIVSMSGNIPQQVQLPSGDAFPTGAQFIIERYGTGTVGIIGTGTVVVQSRGNVSNLSGQFSVATAIYRKYSTWLIVGDLG